MITILLTVLYSTVLSVVHEYKWSGGSQTINDCVDTIGSTPCNRNGAGIALLNSTHTVIFGGETGNVPGTTYSEVWLYSFSSSSWSYLTGTYNNTGVYSDQQSWSGTSHPRTRAHVSVGRYSDTIFYLFGGFDNGHHLEDIWLYDVSLGPGLPQWKWVIGSAVDSVPVYGTIGEFSAGNKIGSRHSVVSHYLPVDRLWIFSGLATGGEMNNDIWIYDFTTAQFAWIRGDNFTNGVANFGVTGVYTSTNTPGARYQAASWMSGDDNIYIFGGYGLNDVGESGYLSDVFCYSSMLNLWKYVGGNKGVNVTGSWASQGTYDVLNVIQPRSGHSALLLNDEEVLIFGGETYTNPGPFINDVWLFNMTDTLFAFINGQFSFEEVPNYVSPGLYSTGTPGGRSGFSMVLANEAEVFIFGGANSNGTFSDYWMFQVDPICAPPCVAERAFCVAENSCSCEDDWYGAPDCLDCDVMNPSPGSCKRFNCVPLWYGEYCHMCDLLHSMDCWSCQVGWTSALCDVPVCDGSFTCGTNAVCKEPQLCECRAGHEGDPYSNCSRVPTICDGKSDVLFVIDVSYSVGDQEYPLLQDFVHEIAMSMRIGPDFQRVSVVEFTSNCFGGAVDSTNTSRLMFPFENNYTKLDSEFTNLDRCGADQSPLHNGLNTAYGQISGNSRSEVQTYVVLITDGNSDSCLGIRGQEPYLSNCSSCLTGHSADEQWWWFCPQCCYDDRYQKDRLESFGTLMFSVVVGTQPDVDVDYYRFNISSYPATSFGINSFDELETLKNDFIERFCYDVISVSPTVICDGESLIVNVSGTGFLYIPMLLRVHDLTFSVSDTYSATYVDINTVTATLSPGYSGEMFVDISLNNGIAWSSHSAIIEFGCPLTICYGLNSTNPSICSGTGICISTDTCECFSGYLGDDCSIPASGYTCFGLNSSDPSVCTNQQGVCTGFDQCDCYDGYFGDECAEFSCTPPCQHGGECVALNTCDCPIGYNGSSCQQEVCTVCYNGGVCVGPEICDCTVGWTLNDCSLPTCGTGCVHGTCVDVNECECQPGYTGLYCDVSQTTTCFGVSDINPLVCSSHGTCEAGSCTCESGYTGDACQIWDCYGKNAVNDPTCCSSAGDCVGIDTCECYSGYSGNECSDFYCDGIISTATSSVCSSGNGVCVEPEICLCKSGYFGVFCDQFQCQEDCNFQGNCISPEVCNCNANWFGDNCQYTTCNGITNVATTVCSGHGTCEEYQTCNCEIFYSGSDCQLVSCFGVYENEPSVCSSHGTCNGKDECGCDSDWQGDDLCSSCSPNLEGINCDQTICDDLQTCNGHGTCDGSFNCVCDAAFAGDWCEICDTGFYNHPNCDVACDSSIDCNGNGECDWNGDCMCFSGGFDSSYFTGTDCSSCEIGYFGAGCSVHVGSEYYFTQNYGGVVINIEPETVQNIGCSDLIHSSDLAKLGGSNCIASRNSENGLFVIIFGSNPTLLQSSTFRINRQAVINAVDSTTSSDTDFVTLTETVVYPPPIPNVILISNPVVGQCSEISLDASLSSSGDSRELIFHFFLVSSDIPQITTIFEARYADSQRNTLSRITLDGSYFAVGQIYQFKVEVESAFGVVAESSIIDVAKEFNEIPDAHVFGLPRKTTTMQATSFSMEGYAVLCNVYLMDTTNYQFGWRQTSHGLGNVVFELLNDGRRIVFRENAFLTAGTFEFTFFAANVNDALQASFQTVSVEVLESELVAIIEGGMYRRVGTTEDVSIDASSSYDPDNEENTAEMFIWTCVETTTGDVKQLAGVTTTTNQFTLPGDTFSFGMYGFFLTYKKGDREITAYTMVEYVELEVPSVSILSHSERINVGDASFVLTAEISYQGASIYQSGGGGVTLEWAMDDGNGFNIIENHRITPVGQSVVGVTGLQPNVEYTFMLTATIGSAVGVAMTVVFTNLPPSIGFFQVFPASGVQQVTEFTFSALNWLDDEDDESLEYAFYYIDPIDGDEVLLIPYRDENQPVHIIPVVHSALQVIARVRDSNGAVSSSIVTVEVTASSFTATEVEQMILEFIQRSEVAMLISDCLGFVTDGQVLFAEHGHVLDSEAANEFTIELLEAYENCLLNDDVSEITEDVVNQQCGLANGMTEGMMDGENIISVLEHVQKVSTGKHVGEKALDQVGNAMENVLVSLTANSSLELLEEDKAEIAGLLIEITQNVVTQNADSQVVGAEERTITTDDGAMTFTLSKVYSETGEVVGENVEISFTDAETGDIVTVGVGLVEWSDEQNPFPEGEDETTHIVSLYFTDDDGVQTDALSNFLVTLDISLGNRRQDAGEPNCAFYDSTNNEWMIDETVVETAISADGNLAECKVLQNGQFDTIGIVYAQEKTTITKPGLSPGAIAGIVIGSIAGGSLFLAIVVIVGVLVLLGVGFLLFGKGSGKTDVVDVEMEVESEIKTGEDGNEGEKKPVQEKNVEEEKKEEEKKDDEEKDDKIPDSFATENEEEKKPVQVEKVEEKKEEEKKDDESSDSSMETESDSDDD